MKARSIMIDLGQEGDRVRLWVDGIEVSSGTVAFEGDVADGAYTLVLSGLDDVEADDETEAHLVGMNVDISEEE